MAKSKLIKELVKTGIQLRNRVLPNQERAFNQQNKVLRKLLETASHTEFGKQYNFEQILNSEDPISAFQAQVPICDYSGMYPWWQRAFNGESDVAWPGKVKFFALSSGTSEDASKFIPVTNETVRAIKRGGYKQTLTVAKRPEGREALTKQTLMVGGSTALDFNGICYTGDLSGITTGNLPFWYKPMAVPPPEIKAKKNWPEKIDEIVRNAKDWDVGIITGTCSWIQIIMERIIDHYELKNIHDIWPNFRVLIHGGVMIDPYKKRFEELFGKEVLYYDTYMASEGFIAYQSSEKAKGMRLLVKNNIFFEFIPFDEENFDESGKPKADAKVVSLKDVVPFTEYALLISTCSGAWRYMIGDVIKFVSKSKYEIKIVGRTKHYISMCGEHLSMENMNTAVREASEHFNDTFIEYTVSGIPSGQLFGHHWFIASENQQDEKTVLQFIDKVLCRINDDYRVERQNAIKDLYLTIVPPSLFVEWLASQGKSGAQIKFPRVLKKPQYESWMEFLKQNGITKKIKL